MGTICKVDHKRAGFGYCCLQVVDENRECISLYSLLRPVLEMYPVSDPYLFWRSQRKENVLGLNFFCPSTGDKDTAGYLESVWQSHIFHWRDNRFWIEHLRDRFNFVFFGFFARIVIHIAGIWYLVSLCQIVVRTFNASCWAMAIFASINIGGGGWTRLKKHQHWFGSSITEREEVLSEKAARLGCTRTPLPRTTRCKSVSRFSLVSRAIMFNSDTGQTSKHNVACTISFQYKTRYDQYSTDTRKMKMK
jgi:hypothetical protein